MDTGEWTKCDKLGGKIQNWIYGMLITQSFIFDMKIFWLTVMSVFKKEGINADGHATMPSLPVRL